MKVTIHKGSQEIGGTCIQLSSGKTTILLDVGLPLSGDSQPVDVSRLVVDAVLISHSHRDHFGLIASLAAGTPVFMGKLARRQRLNESAGKCEAQRLRTSEGDRI